GSWMVKAVTHATDFRFALVVFALLMFLAWPIALFAIRDKPSEKGQFPDGDSEAPPQASIQPRSFGYLLRKAPFWLLLIGSFCSIGSIGAINFHMKFVFEDQGFTAQSVRDAVWSQANIIILCSSIVGRIVIGVLADRLAMKWVMFVTYFIVAATIPLLLMVAPPETPWAFSILFGFAMGADYMLIPLMAARQFGVNTLARAMAIILPANTIGQTWFPYFVSLLREHAPDYRLPLYTVFTLAMLGAAAIAVLPRRGAEDAAAMETAAKRV
ncbi:MAG: MFS transporter, partial [Acidobacteria bacterium]|nr:MFS transporter [Acidobacteriota bacterium]